MTGGKEKKKGVKVKEERKVAPGVTPPIPPLTPPPLASLFSFDQDKNLGDCRAQIKGGGGALNNLNATNLDSGG